MSERPLKFERDEQQLFNTRVIVAAVFILLVLLGIAARVYHLQVLENTKYAELSRQHYQKRIPIPPNRGQIYDRNGVLLADSHTQHVLEVVRDSIGDENGDGKSNLADVDMLVERLGKFISLSEKDVRVFKQNVRKFKFQPVPIKENLSEEEVATFSVNRPRFPGVNLEVRMERYYPLGTIASHVIGYVGRIDDRDMEKLNKDEYLGTSHIGKTGIEAFHEGRLHGQAGYHLVEVDAHGKQQAVLDEKSPIGGQDLFLGIDINLQMTAERLLKNERGAVVAIDPQNGEVLALASVPTFDPNLFINGISNKDYSELRDNPDRPLYNRALQGTYPPGSTIKPMVGVAGLADGVINPGSHVYDPGYFRLSGQKHVFRCWNKRGHGSVNLKYAITQSCDTFFYDMAYRMGIDRFSTAMHKFGFGEQTGIDLPSESTGLMPTQAWKEKRHKRSWYPGDTVNIGIGQGYWLATPLQLAHATTILANRGKRLKPHVLRGVRIAKNQEEEVLKPEPFPTIETEERFWDLNVQGMENVMRPGGTARAAGAGAAYRIAGKTGTAQVFGLAGGKYNAGRIAKRLRDHALFVGFAPVDDPKIAVAVIMENALGGGGSVAAPIARKVMDAYLLKQYDNDETLEADKATSTATPEEDTHD
ncbi:MAG TPA: penicillin-binding protein 2 [Candidatus Thiothrix moscowensis]|uniref:penicillin-binding protein 2 n=1 Tax=unclassified Thiothrix TaxID=2636184 RepID=UPI0025F71CBC|nr:MULTISPECIES: penicillin-binding protein 2 [unclassified Thiothrix]HRJ53498.1 penicillin-binding protein 2 [Candidatus Thiothrix moscowensis]HRJ93577.1 penicillin-binding protein 2 [Candidatus Thiothrix moscowensis]